MTEQLTAEVNRLWKLLRYASSDLYLALGGKNPEVECDPKVLKNAGILNLLISTPDVGGGRASAMSRFSRPWVEEKGEGAR